MKATKPKLGFRNRSVPEKIGICTRFIRAVATLPPEARPYIALDQLESELREAEDAVDGLERLHTQMQGALARRNEAVARLCATVHSNSARYSRVLISPATVGLKPARYGARAQVPRTPDRFRVLRLFAGGARLAWTRHFRGGFFLLQVTTTPADPASWKVLGGYTSARSDVTGLHPGVRYWLRVAERNSAGTSPWSQPLSVMAA